MKRPARWIAILAAIFAFSSYCNVWAADEAQYLHADTPLTLSGEELPDDVNRVLMALVLKLRGYGERDIAEHAVRFKPDAFNNIPSKMNLLDGFVFEGVDFTALLPSNPPGQGRRLAGLLVFEDLFSKGIELSFGVDYVVEGDVLLVKGAGIGENSPIPPRISAYIVPSKDVPKNFWEQFPSWEDAYVFARAKQVPLGPPGKVPVGKQAYHVFQFIHDRLPEADRVASVTASTPEGTIGEASGTTAKVWNGWHLLVTERTMDLTADQPLFFKLLHRPTATGLKDMDGKDYQLFTFTPMGGGEPVAEVKEAPKAVAAELKLENVALNRPTLVMATGTYSKSKDPTQAGAGAVNGKFEGYGFHSDKLKNPWWQVDLGEGVAVHKLKIKNRPCCSERARTLRVLFSNDGENWTQVHDQAGKNFSWLEIPVEPQPVRYVRLQLNEKNYFHLEEVEVYGTRGQAPVRLSKADKTTQSASGKLDGHWYIPAWKSGMDVWTQNNRLLAYYIPKNDKGWMWLEDKGAGYEGWWVETMSNQKCKTQRGGSFYWGRITLVPDGDGIKGKWSYCDKPLETAWAGQRRGDERQLSAAPKWPLFGDDVAQMVPGKISPISDDGKVRLEVTDPAEGFRLINEDIGYSLLPPFDNWRIAKPDADGDLIIHDQTGCLMSFAPTTTFSGAPQSSPEAFEAYWWETMTSVKEGEGAVRHTPSSLSVNGLEAMSVRYDTKDGPWHFYYIQLPHRLLLAAFTCPTGDFKAQYPKYEKAVSTLTALTGAPVPKPAQVAARPKPEATQSQPEPSDGPRRFAEPGFGYTMPYPPSWVYEKPSQWTVVFSGPEGTDAYYTTVTVQNLQASTYPDMNAVIEDLKQQLKASGKKHRWHHTVPYLHMDDMGNVEGKQFTMEYWEGKQKLRRSGVLIPRPKFGVYHYWSYTAPEALWSESLDLAEAMRDGFQRVAAAASAPMREEPLSGSASGAKPGQRIFNQSDGYSFIPPAGWNVSERQKNSVINVTDGNCELRFAMGQIGNLSLEAYADKWENVSVKPDYLFKKRYNREALRFNGLDAVSTEYDTGPNTGLMTFVRLPNEVLGVRATCKEGPLAQVYEKIEYSMKSITALAR